LLQFPVNKPFPVCSSSQSWAASWSFAPHFFPFVTFLCLLDLHFQF
jgi:hypothetical protein